MSNEYEKVLKLEKKLEDFVIDGIDTTDVECEKVVLQISKLLDKINNSELLNLLTIPYALNDFIDVTVYFKKYKLNYKELKENNSYKEEFKKLSLLVEEIREKAISEEEYQFICYKCDVDNTASYLLGKMNNKDIMNLANEADDWSYKLFLFQNLKK